MKSGVAAEAKRVSSNRAKTETMTETKTETSTRGRARNSPQNRRLRTHIYNASLERSLPTQSEAKIVPEVKSQFCMTRAKTSDQFSGSCFRINAYANGTAGTVADLSL